MGKTPTLYKILSMRHWYATQNQKVVRLSADDDAFIHFSTKEQLGRILEKYWSEPDQYVVLKINPDRLKGDLIFEKNPGGATKYYHLYNGSIPFEAILEATITYRNHPETSSSHQIVKQGHPALRQKARVLSKEEILSDEIQTLIQEMKETMREAPGVGLAAPQIGLSLQLAVIEDADHDYLSPEVLKKHEREPVPFHVIINPKIEIDKGEMVEFFEGCLSDPDFVGVVPRARQVRVECLNERAEPVVIEAKGWYARILQHEIDHLNGTVCLDHMHLRTLMTSENYLNLWKNKSVEEAKIALTPN